MSPELSPEMPLGSEPQEPVEQPVEQPGVAAEAVSDAARGEETADAVSESVDDTTTQPTVEENALPQDVREPVTAPIVAKPVEPEKISAPDPGSQAATAKAATAKAVPVAGPPATKAVPVPLLTLAPASVSRDLVTLRRDSVALSAPYERVAGRVLGRPWRRTTLFFTSTQSDQGSTAVAVNVATMLSRRTKSVLLVELQLTEPSLWSLFGRPRMAAGLEDALRGRAPFDACLCEIGGEKLDVLVVKEAMAVEEIEHLSGALNDFLEWAEERFAWLVVDCPPVLAASWTRWFDLNADPVVLVAGSAKTKKHELRKVAQRLGDRLAGTILNENRGTKRAS